MQVERKTFADLTGEERAAWQAFQTADPALRGPYFRLEYAEAVASRRRGAHVLVARDRQGLLAFLALEAGGLAARPLGGSISDLHGVIVRPGVQLDFQAFARAAGLSLFSFSGVPEGERGVSAYSGEHEPWHAIDLSMGAQAWRKDARKRSNSFKRLNGKWNKLERAFGQTELTLDSRCEAAFDQLWAWKSRQYRESGHHDLARTAWFRDLMEEFFTRGTPEFRGVLSTLSCEGRPVAAHFGIMADGVLHYWFPAYDPLAHRFSPGLLLLDGLCERHEELAISRVDLGPGAYRYKQEFANAAFALHSGLAGAGPVFAAARAMGEFDRKLSALPLKGFETVPRRAVRKLDRMMAA